jgi:hypothetical protein
MPNEQKKKKAFSLGVTVGERGRLSPAEIRQIAESDPAAFMDKVNRAIESGDLSLQTFRAKDMARALLDVQVPAHVDVLGEQRAITTGAFPLLTGGLVVAALNAAYESVPTIGDQLVTEMEDNKKVTSVAAVHTLDKDTDVVKEGDPFPEIGASEEKAEIRSNRNGRRLTITAETIEENDVADIVDRVNALGEIAATWVEEQTLARVTDKHGSNTTLAAAPYAYRPSGAGTALFSASANTPGARAPSGTRVTNNALVDETSLENARTVLAAMLDGRGKRIGLPINQSILLVPDALSGVAAKILNSELVPGVENELNNWGPRGQYRPRLLTSSKLDDIATDAWYLGLPQRQFVRKWKLRMEYVTMSGSTQEYLERRIAFQSRIAWDVEIGARDYIGWIQNLASTTYTPS